MKSRTATIAKPIDRHGKLYQQRALAVLPLLVRQAQVGETIYYSDLAAELRIPNERNLNYVLGSVGASLNQLSVEWQAEVPPLQALVVNRGNELPGAGFTDSLVNPSVLDGVSQQTRKRIIDGMLAEVYAFPRWEEVLEYFEVEPAGPPVEHDKLKRTTRLPRSTSESQAHLALKAHVASNPRSVGITQRVLRTAVEYRLPTGDEIDVVFFLRRRVVGVEVKSLISTEEDLIRGVFQCIKYDALLNAEAKATASLQDIHTLLAVGGRLPHTVLTLANALGVSVIADLHPSSSPAA